MFNITHINEDFLDAVDSEDLKVQSTLDDLHKADVIDPYYEFTLLIFHNLNNPDLETDMFKTRKRLSKLVEMTFADNMRSEMLTITYDISEKIERKIGWMTDDYTKHKYIEDNVKTICQDTPSIFTCVSFNTSNAFTPQMFMRFFTVVTQILLKLNIDDVCVARNRTIHEVEYLPSLFTYDAVLTDYMYSSIRKNNRTLNIDNTDEIVIVTTAFIDVYKIFRDYFFRNRPMRAALKAVPQFDLSAAMMIQVKQMIDRDTQIVPSDVVRIEDFDVTIHDKDFYETCPMCYEFACDLNSLQSWGKQNNFETKLLGTGFTTDHCADIIKPYYNNTMTVPVVYYMTIKCNHPNFYYPLHFLFCYLGAYFDDNTKWPYFGGCLISAKKKSDLEKMIQNKLP